MIGHIGEGLPLALALKFCIAKFIRPPSEASEAALLFHSKM